MFSFLICPSALGGIFSSAHICFLRPHFVTATVFSFYLHSSAFLLCFLVCIWHILGSYMFEIFIMFFFVVGLHNVGVDHMSDAVSWKVIGFTVGCSVEIPQCVLLFNGTFRLLIGTSQGAERLVGTSHGAEWLVGTSHGAEMFFFVRFSLCLCRVVAWCRRRGRHVVVDTGVTF